MRNFIFSFLALILLPAYMSGQVIKGSVLDETGLPLPGVSITAVTTGIVTISDFDGNFSIKAQPEEMLKFTFIGFKEITIAASAASKVNMQLASTDLAEVVVVGFGTQKRGDLSGAISSVKSEQILKQPAYNALQSLQGKAAGVNIIASDAPGSTPTIIIRGLGTAEAGRTPMYIVDGIQTSSIANLNPADIETFDIMKDASSAAIYGSNAANGVVIITTKKGKSGKTVVRADSFYGTKSILNQVKMANADQYIAYWNERQPYVTAANAYNLSPNHQYDTDWFDALTDIGFTQSNNISFSGGNDNSTYFFSFNNYSEDGVLKDQDLSRNTIRANNSFKAFDGKLKITNNLSAAFTKSTPKPFDAFTDAYRQSPLVPVYYENGAFGQNYVNTTTGQVGYIAGPGQSISRLNSTGNPLSNVYYANDKNNTTDIQGSIEAELKLADGLKFTSRFGATKTYTRTRNFNNIRGRWLTDDPTRTGQQFDDLQTANPEVITYANNSLTYGQVESLRYNWDNFLTFDKSFGKHNLNLTAGMTKERRNDVYQSSIQGYNVPDQEQYWNIDKASSDYEKVATQNFLTPVNVLSYFGRVQYNYDSKYYINATIRRDGNSNFKQNADYWGTFPSVSAAWVLTKESFLTDIKNLDLLKLRVGYGELGNANVPFNQTTISSGPGSANYNYVFGPNQDLNLGANSGTPATNLTWEVTKEINAGFDFGILNNKLSGTFDYYNRLNTNAILKVKPVLDSPNSLDFYDHGGKVRNEGYEITLNWKDQINDDWSYGIGVNYAGNKNTLEDVKPAYDGTIGGNLGNGENTKRLQAGQPLYAWWMYEAAGVWQNQAEIDANPHYGTPTPGQLRYKDQNGDGLIDDKDKKFFGSYVPKYTYGITLNVAYKNFDLSADGFGAGGNKVYNGLKGTRINGGENIAADTFNGRWHGDGTSNVNPGANRDALASSYYLEDGDYLRINNITIGYTFKDMFKLSKLRIYATAQNPFLFTKYSGFTPELNNSGAPSETAGIELSAYPNIKTFVFGVNIEL